jgi:hypothetical protein
MHRIFTEVDFTSLVSEKCANAQKDMVRHKTCEYARDVDISYYTYKGIRPIWVSNIRPPTKEKEGKKNK